MNRAGSMLVGMSLLSLVLACQPDPMEEYREVAERIIDSALATDRGYRRLEELTDRFGHRFSGSESLERALDWILTEMEQDGLENVRGEPVTVPRWVRGDESLLLLEPRRVELPVLGLGGSVGTPADGITGEVLVVGSVEELRSLGSAPEDKIVLFNVPFTTYRETVEYRSQGAVWAAQQGAVASIIRSVTPFSMRTPHTGGMSYQEGVPRIPHAAMSVEDAEMLDRIEERGERIVVRLAMDARTLPDVPSRNVVAELVGSELPREVVVVGGHIDSWDVGQGAMDDAGGSVAAWEAVRLIKELGLRPRRTLRVVLWTNEENGLGGAKAYRDAHLAELDDHVLAVESDAGVFDPRGFGFTGSVEAGTVVRQIAELLSPIGADSIFTPGGGADVGVLNGEGVPMMGLSVDGSKYFWYHHTESDTVDKLDPGEMAQCIAALAVMIYTVADLPQALPR